ncbi:MAG: hypothetical protein ACLR8U_13365 [Oscillospiraceae bacterium]
MSENEREKKQMEPANDAETQKQAQIDQRRRMIQLLAGTYLLYLAYQLISSAVQEAAWSTMKIVSLIAGVIFGLTGAALLIFNVRAELKRAREMTKPKRRSKEKTSDEQFHERSDESDFRSLRRILPVHLVPAGAGKAAV